MHVIKHIKASHPAGLVGIQHRAIFRPSRRPEVDVLLLIRCLETTAIQDPISTAHTRVTALVHNETEEARAAGGSRLGLALCTAAAAEWSRA